MAISSLVPDVAFRAEDGKITNWYSDSIPQPTQEEIDEKSIVIQAEYDSQQYARDRATDYPPVTDYLDGIVKGDTAQIDKYVADCLAVKVKYPKP